MNRYEYEIAGIKILCEIPFEMKIKEESKPFLRQISEKERSEAMLTMQFCMVNAVPEMGKSYHQEGCRYYVETAEEWRVYFCASPTAEPYACTVWDRKGKNRILCQYLEGTEEYLEYSRNIVDHLGLEMLLRWKEGVLLHASFVRWNGKGILFTAPSGTGKSTQADLWEQYESAEILNGDRAAIRFVDGKEFAYGLPYAGSSGVYKNEKAEIAAIVVLRQAKENRIRRLSPQEAVPYLYPELTIHRWDKAFVEESWSVILRLLGHVPVYFLECLPEQGAVELVKRKIMK